MKLEVFPTFVKDKPKYKDISNVVDYLKTKDFIMTKYALVTGGSRGIGRAICIRLASEGYHVLINYNQNHDEAEKTLKAVRDTGSDGELIHFDVANREQVAGALNLWTENHPDDYIEVLINNAGITRTI